MPDFTISGPRNAVNVQLPGGSADAQTARQAALAAEAARDAVLPAAAQVADDAAATTADRIATGQDRVATNQDRAQTNLDRIAAANSATTATTQAGIATTQANTAVAAVATGRVRKATLAELNASLNYPADAVGEVDNDGANNGQYVKTGASGSGSWVRTSTATVGALGAILSDAPGPTGYLLAFRATQADGGRAIYAGFRNQGREFFAAGTRWTHDPAAGVARWARAAGGPVLDLDATGVRTDGALSFGASRNAISESPAASGIEFSHQIQGYPFFYYGQRQHYAAGMWNVLAADNSRTIRDTFRNLPPLLQVSATGVATWRNALRGVDDGLTGGPLLVVRQLSDGAGAAFSVDAFGRLALIGSASPYTPPRATDARFYGITGTGDESVALKAAHDAAFAAGIRYLNFQEMQVTAPTANALGNVIFVGARQLVGTYRKRVIPLAAPSIALSSGVIPSRHLTAFAAAANPVVAIMGDSTTVPAEAMHRSLGLWGAITRKMRRDNPHKTITFHNRGVSGTTWTAGDSRPGGNFPSWYTNTGRDWLLYVQDLAPDTLFFNWGTNDAESFSISAMESVLSKVRAWAKVPDIILCTNLTPSIQASSTKQAQEARDYAAGYQRSYAIRNNIGLLDFHRQGVMARDGFDLLDQPLQRIQNGGAITLPYTFGTETPGAYIFEIRSASNLMGIFTAGAVLEFPLSSAAGNSLLVRVNGSNIEIQVQTSASRVIRPWASTGFTSIDRLAFSLSAEGYCTVEFNNAGTEVFGGYVEKFGGLFAPRIGRVGDNTAISCTLLQAAVGVPRLCAPVVTDREMWGPTSAEWSGTNNYDGNGVNHASAAGAAAAYFPVVAATNFAT